MTTRPLVHLRLSLYGSPIGKHPQQIMKELGINYLIAVPQSISDSWEFWCCENVPDESQLPDYLRVMVVHSDVDEHIGWGLSQEMADRIKARMEEQ